jgi:hypothetical protein
MLCRQLPRRWNSLFWWLLHLRRQKVQLFDHVVCQLFITQCLILGWLTNVKCDTVSDAAQVVEQRRYCSVDKATFP